jgi:myo-inositol-1(or 4)-monophosphatase
VTPALDLPTILAGAETVAREAGGVLLEGWGKRPAFRLKASEVDLVTEFDRRSEELVVQRLRELFPAHGIVAEEGSRIEGHPGAPVWYVDPLDGTTNFAHGLPLFAVSLGLALGTQPLVGVVHAPALGWTFSGAVGHGAHRNGEPLSPSLVDDLKGSLIVTGFPYARDLQRDHLPEFAAFTTVAQGTRRLGSAALDLAFVAAGWLDGYWERYIKPWDTVGGAAVLTAAGGRVTDVDGAPFDPQNGRVLASNGRVHDAMVALIAAAHPQR